MSYLLDANVFIQAKNDAYGFDICPGFWEWLLQEHAAGKVCSVDKVGEELMAGDDELAGWARDQGSAFFLPMDGAAIQAFAGVSTWVQDQPRYDQAAANLFFGAADYYLVAFALAHGHTLVTHETPAPQAKKVKIPTVCIGVGVKFTRLWQMLRSEKARFVLQRGPGGE